MTEKQGIEEIRMKLWADVVVAYTASSNSTKMSYGSVWADEYLKGFDERFSNKEEK